MKGSFSYFFRYFIVFIFSSTLHIDTVSADSSSVRLSHHVPTKAINNATFLEHVDSNTHVPMTFVLPLRNKDALEELVRRIHDPNDSHYGKYLTSEEFIELFAPTQEDYNKVIEYAKSLGLTITGNHPNRTLVNVSGNAASIETAFNLNFHHYQKPNGHKFYAPNNNPEVPHAIASIIHGVVGLDNHSVRRAFNRQKQTTKEPLTSNVKSQTFPSGPGGGYSPNDLLTAYNLKGISADGSGQVIALFELAGYQASDIKEYTNYFGLPAPQLTNILVDGGSTDGIDAEVTLDIELAIALAPKSQIYVYEGPNSDQGVLDTYNRIATDNIAKQVSTSWGMGEDLSSPQFLQAENAIFLQMAAHGQTIYAAAGDSGAYDDSSSKTLVVDDPASQPYVVSVGGTKLKVNSVSGTYGTEQVWNEGFNNGAGGGGVSAIWPIPSWQKNISTLYSTTHRNVPDVSLNADPNTGYSIYYNGQWTTYGGTSCAAPLWAAFTACVNQKLAASQKPVLGFANPALYAIGTGSLYSTNFHDITSGNNLYYSAETGYDNATGWGSFNGASLFTSLTTPAPTPTPPPQPLPLLNLTMNHVGRFALGRVGTYQIAVSNQGKGPTSGAVAVTVTLPNGLSYRSFTGSGWTFNQNTLTFTQNGALKPSASYPLITLKVDVDYSAARLVAPTATVSGGGSTSSTVTSPTSIK